MRIALEQNPKNNKLPMIPDLNISLFYSNEIKTLVGLLGSSLRKLKRSKYQNGKFQLQKQL